MHDIATPDIKQRMADTVAVVNADVAQKALNVSPLPFRPHVQASLSLVHLAVGLWCACQLQSMRPERVSRHGLQLHNFPWILESCLLHTQMCLMMPHCLSARSIRSRMRAGRCQGHRVSCATETKGAGFRKAGEGGC